MRVVPSSINQPINQTINQSFCPAAGMEKLLDVQRELLGLVQQCTSGPPVQRLTFGAVGRRLRTIQKHAAQLGVATVTPHR